MNTSKYISACLICLTISLASCGDEINGNDNSDSVKPGENNAYNNDAPDKGDEQNMSDPPGTNYPGSRVDSTKREPTNKLDPSPKK